MLALASQLPPSALAHPPQALGDYPQVASTSPLTGRDRAAVPPGERRDRRRAEQHLSSGHRAALGSQAARPDLSPGHQADQRLADPVLQRRLATAHLR